MELSPWGKSRKQAKTRVTSSRVHHMPLSRSVQIADAECFHLGQKRRRRPRVRTTTVGRRRRPRVVTLTLWAQSVFTPSRSASVTAADDAALGSGSGVGGRVSGRGAASTEDAAAMMVGAAAMPPKRPSKSVRRSMGISLICSGAPTPACAHDGPSTTDFIASTTD